MLTIDRVDPFGVIRLEVVEPAAQLGQRRRAHVGTVGVAEEHDQHAVVGSDEAERLPVPADVRDRGDVDLRLGVAGEADELAVLPASGNRHGGEHGDENERPTPRHRSPPVVAGPSPSSPM